MTRNLSVTILFVFLASFFAARPVQAAKSYYAERFDVHIDLQENGSAVITETVEFHFEGDPFTFAFREVSARETDGITFLDAEMNGVPMTQGTQAGQVEVERGDGLKVTWHFPPASDTAHVFTLRYRVDGIIRRDQGDTLIWRAIPENHEYSIDRSTITLTYPPEASPLEQPSLDWDHDAAWESGRVVLTAGGLGEDEELIVRARFPEGSLTASAPLWQVQKERAGAATARALPFGLTAGLLTLIAGGFGLWTYARASSRELTINPVISTAYPPSDLSPALVGKLTGQPHSPMSAIFDLAQRGVLDVREEKGFWGSRNHILVLKDPGISMQPYERGLLDALFKQGETQVNMSEVGTRLATKKQMFEDPLQEELVRRGWLDAERKQKRTWLSAAGLMLMIFSMIVFILSMVAAGMSIDENPGLLPWLAVVVGISAGLFVLSIPWLVYGATYSILTPAGEELAARWKGFGDYLKQVSRGKEPAIRPDTFEKYLAYAAVFGLGAAWAKYFKELGGVPLPVWFHAMAGSKGDFSAMVAVMSASDSSGAGGGGGGAGASGGGSSGAG